MDLTFSPAEERFRTEVSDFMRAECSLAMDSATVLNTCVST